MVLVDPLLLSSSGPRHGCPAHCSVLPTIPTFSSLGITFFVQFSTPQTKHMCGVCA